MKIKVWLLIKRLTQVTLAVRLPHRRVTVELWHAKEMNYTMQSSGPLRAIGTNIPEELRNQFVIGQFETQSYLRWKFKWANYKLGFAWLPVWLTGEDQRNQSTGKRIPPQPPEIISQVPSSSLQREGKLRRVKCTVQWLGFIPDPWQGLPQPAKMYVLLEIRCSQELAKRGLSFFLVLDYYPLGD